MENFSLLTFAQLLGALLLVTLVSKLFGMLFQKMHQPEVMGEVIGGIFLGPSFVGHFFPTFFTSIFNPEAIRSIGIFANFGIVLYMFVVGVELNIDELKKSLKSTFTISFASVIFPFVLGLILSRFLLAHVGSEKVNEIDFAFFVGIAMAITAFPVLARILSDLKLTKTPMGILALTCAALNDVIAWCLLAFLVSRVRAVDGNIFSIYGLSAIYIAGVIYFIKPKIQKWIGTDDRYNKIILLFSAALVSSLVTNFIGIHAIFGAFLIGAIVPFNSPIAAKIENQYKKYIQIIFLPAFFAFTGMKTKINLLNDPKILLISFLIIVVAIMGKMGGTIFASRFFKKSWKESLILGVLMNTRGLVELIVLNVGLELHIISEELFTMLVIMAVVTTLLTGPLLQLFKIDKPEY